MPRDDRFTHPEDELDTPAPPARTRARSIKVTTPPDDADELDARAGDVDSEDEQQFLRAPRRVAVRKGVNTKTAKRLKWAGIGIAILLVLFGISTFVYNYATRSWRFQIQSSDTIEIVGTVNTTRSQILEPFGGDIGRNLFKVPLDERKKDLEQIPWVESATVMRFWPNRLKVEIKERTPVAFVQIGAKISLVDANGVIMDLPARYMKKYSFPVIVGFAESEPLSTRAARMRIYTKLVSDLDSEGVTHSRSVSEVDLNDPDDVKITVSDPQGAVLIHLGNSNFLDRYKVYLSQVNSWREQFQKLQSVDLRYDGQIIVNPDHAAGKTIEIPAPAKAVSNEPAPKD